MPTVQESDLGNRAIPSRHLFSLIGLTHLPSSSMGPSTTNHCTYPTHLKKAKLGADAGCLTPLCPDANEHDWDVANTLRSKNFMAATNRSLRVMKHVPTNIGERVSCL